MQPRVTKKDAWKGIHSRQDNLLDPDFILGLIGLFTLQILLFYFFLGP